MPVRNRRSCTTLGVLLLGLTACGRPPQPAGPAWPTAHQSPAPTPKRQIATKTGAAAVPAAAAPAPAIAPSPPAVTYPAATSFQLEDQYGELHVVRFPRDKATVLSFGDKDGSAQLDGWIRPLYARYEAAIHVQGVAELGLVPGFARGIVTAIMSSQVKYPVMLDWQGTISQAYGYRGGQAALIVINRAGDIVHRTAGAVTPAALQTLYDQIDAVR